MLQHQRATATGLLDRDFRAIKAFFIRTTVPLIYEDEGVAGLQGSGCLFETEGRLFFVTAGHVLEGVDPRKLGVPLRAHGGEVFELGNGVVGCSQMESFDVAAYRIDDAHTCSALRASYLVLGTSNVAQVVADSNRFIVVGYPAQTVIKDGQELRPTDLTQIHTRQYDGDVVGARGEQDLFLKLRRQGHGLWAQPTVLPDLRGISGGPVWQAFESAALVWTPESALRLIGIEVSCDPRCERYIRVLRWEVVQAALKKLAAS